LQYSFEFDNGVRTPVSDLGQVNRHEQRSCYFFDALLSVTGGSLRGHRVLDLGCNSGFWALKAIEAGADFVLGVDARESHLEQANLVFEAKGIDPSCYRFEQGNIFEHDFAESFDVVLCLGVMEVTSKPVELFELMTGVGAEIIVIDTVISRARPSFFEVSSLNNPRDKVDHDFVLLPSRQAVEELASQFGFETVPLELNMTDYAGLADYEHQRRLAFIAAKSASLAGLQRAKSPLVALPWWIERLKPLRGGR
jgi:tRNA (mo5U34)-methyltransferase